MVFNCILRSSMELRDKENRLMEDVIGESYVFTSGIDGVVCFLRARRNYEENVEWRV